FRIYREVTPWDAVNGMRRDLQKARADAEDMRQALQHGKGGVSKESARLARELAYQYQVGLAHAVAEAGKLWSLAEALSPPRLQGVGAAAGRGGRPLGAEGKGGEGREGLGGVSARGRGGEGRPRPAAPGNPRRRHQARQERVPVERQENRQSVTSG